MSDVSEPETSATPAAPRVHSEMIEKLAADDMEMFWEDIARTLPLVTATVDGEVLVTFCWRDDHADAVLLLAGGLTDEAHPRRTLLERKPGTDLWHATFRLGPAWRGSYLFVVQRPGHPAPWLTDGALDLRAAAHHGRPDPHNPLECRDADGVVHSVVEGPQAPPQRWLAERPGIEHGAVMWHAAPDGRGSWFYEPPGVGLDVELPLVVVLDGDVWTGPQSLPTTLDNLIADGEVPTVRAVFLDPTGRGGAEAETAYVADRLLPWVRGARALSPGAVTAVGHGDAGLVALRLGLTRPDVVGAVVAHSATLTDDVVRDLPAATPTRVHLAHGTHEALLGPRHRALAERLAATGPDARVVLEVHDGGHDPAWWRGAVADGLRAVLRRDGG